MRLPLLGDIQLSKKNGLIRTTPKGEVWAGGIKQTSIGYRAMWSDVLARTPVARPVSKVLMLGLAGGGALGAIHATYPDAATTAVEYDPVMVEVARDLLKGSQLPFPQVIVGDAQEVLVSHADEFDLILVDIFVGPRPSPLVDDMRFWAALRARLAQGGSVALNVAGDSTRIYEAQKHFKHSTSWQYKANTFCALFS